MTEQGAGEYAEVVAVLPLSRCVVGRGDGSRLAAFFSRRLVHRGRRPQVGVGDRVVVERSPLDPAVCRIVAWEKDV